MGLLYGSIIAAHCVIKVEGTFSCFCCFRSLVSPLENYYVALTQSGFLLFVLLLLLLLMVLLLLLVVAGFRRQRVPFATGWPQGGHCPHRARYCCYRYNGRTEGTPLKLIVKVYCAETMAVHRALRGLFITISFE